MNMSSKKTISKLTARFLKASKMRNIIAVIAIALTSIMFTSVFTIGGNMIDSIQEQTMRQIGSCSHGSLKYLTREQYENFSQSPLLKDISYSIILGIAENNALLGSQYEIRYSQDNNARWGFSFPSVGKMPQMPNEIACSTITLDALSVPHEIGTEVPLEFIVGGVSYSETFTLSGYWIGDPVMQAQQIWLSKDYVKRVLSENIITDNFTGTISADIWFSNTFNIENKIQRLINERGYQENEISYGVSWAYMAADIDFATLAIVVLVLALILLSGYLIIYSIFVISINADIHFFGLLKIIGITEKQIRKIVRGQALILAAFGIPVGLLFGYFCGVSLTPLMFNMLSVPVNVNDSANLLIFIFAVIFSLLTVFIGCNKPAKIAARVSPVEAVKYSGITVKSKSKKTRKVTPLSMALANITREKRKLYVNILSLSLALILLNSAFSAARSFDMDAFISGSIISDFVIADNSLLSTNLNKNTNGVTDDFLREAETHDTTEITNIYYHESKTFQVYGIAETELAYFSDIDYEKLSFGNYALVSRHTISYGDNPIKIPQIGDILTLTNDNGETEDFEVIGLIDAYPRQISARFFLGNSLDVVIADSVFLDFYGAVQPMQTNINVSAEYISAFESWLESYTSNTNLRFISRNTLKAEFDAFAAIYLLMGSALSFIIALVGVLNFINAIAASVIARRREFAMLQSVGMTGKQLRHTLFYEGSSHAILSLCFTLTIGAALGLMIVQVIAGQAWFFKQNFTVLPTIICAVPLLIICAVAPLVCYKRLAGESLIERLRIE